MEIWSILGDVVVLLGACLLVGGLFTRMGQSPIVGYLFAGMLLGGPGSIHAVRSEHEIEAVAELGVALLLFSLGLEFSLDRLAKLGAKPLLGGAVQVALTILFAFAGARLCGMPVRESLAFGAMVSLSSTAVVLRILMERGEMEMPHGRNSLGVLLTQDMAVVPLALMTTILGGTGGSDTILWELGKLCLMTAGLLVGLYVLNQIAVLALGTLTLYRNRELTVIFAVVSGLGAGWAAHLAGVSPALGAFVAGMLLGSSSFATQIRADVSSLRVVLLTLFFGAAGMVADPIWILSNAHIVGSVAALITVGKLAIIWLIFLALGQTNRVAAATGLCLAQIGEFAFVLGSIGRANGVVSEEVNALVVSVTIVSFVLSALLVPLASSFGNRIAKMFAVPGKEKEPEGQKSRAPDIVIIGFGPAGRLAAQPLVDSKLSVTVVDLNIEGIRQAEQLGFHGEVGDATQAEVFEHARLHDCKLIIITVPHDKSAMLILDRVRKEAPHVHTIVRARYERHAGEFAAAGAHTVCGDEQQVGECLASHILDWQKKSISTDDGR